MKKVTILQPHVGLAYFPGDEVELEAKTAQKLIDGGFAVAGKADSKENAQLLAENLTPEDQKNLEDGKADPLVETPENPEQKTETSKKGK
ncbi:hypothetical protein BWI93_19135 [Siphonobacter sp. BAB-5385]|uniref:hypothetical protein n=1 Tax=Siphonobacter sp. BAB-5385 TaxID=1864822 RepID=UPI000B9E348C|nr:hypothetical protein [Siphonobacter sp. BAB-5385]OZI06595.1 hypothetical protein BWI93_19135 [Siphonobacter sp. BAB-5385]